MNSIHKEGKSHVAYPPTEEAGKETAPFLNWNGPKGTIFILNPILMICFRVPSDEM